jgi:hypothetical protein
MSYEIGEYKGLPARERTHTIEVKADPDSDYRITGYRERAGTTPTGETVVRDFALPTERRLSQIIDEEYTYNGKTLTGAEFVGFISLIMDTWKLQDESSPQMAQRQANLVPQRRAAPPRVKPKTLREIRERHSTPRSPEPKVDMRPLTRQGRVSR